MPDPNQSPPATAPTPRPPTAASAPAPRLAASYGRSAETHSGAVARQHAANVAAAARDGFVLPDGPDFRWEDDGWSGATPDRPALSALLAVIEAGRAPFTRLYLTDPSRLSRSPDPRALSQLEVRLASCGVSVRYAAYAYAEGRPAGDETAEPDALRGSLAGLLVRAVEDSQPSAVRARRPGLDP